MGLFRNAPPQEPLIVSIAGVRMGQRILGVIGGDTRMFLDAAAKVGISGTAYALTTDAAGVARVQEAAVKHGVLVDAGPIALPVPLPDASFDLALLDDRAPGPGSHSTPALLGEMCRVLRPGGRIILAVPAPSSAFAGLFGFTPRDPDVAPLLRSLLGTGFTAARLLVTQRGVAFVEAARAV